MHKYRAVKTYVGGIKFDSKKESQMYLRLLLMQEAGQIRNLELQIPFELQPKTTYMEDGKIKVMRPIIYIADFVYIDVETGEKCIVDCKGFKTEAYKIKKKLFLYKYKAEGWRIKETIN